MSSSPSPKKASADKEMKTHSSVQKTATPSLAEQILAGHKTFGTTPNERGKVPNTFDADVSDERQLAAINGILDEAKELGLKVGHSQIDGAGFGLFAARKFSKGTRLLEYVGEALTESAYTTRYPDRKNAPPCYVISPRAKTYVDAVKFTASNAARFINRPPPGGRANVKLTTHGNILTMRPINAGDELLMSYGVDYHTPSSAKRRDAPVVLTAPPAKRAATASAAATSAAASS